MNKSRIVIVEDDLAVRSALTEWLSDQYQITCYESAESFLDAIDQFDLEDGTPSCILLDFQMPEMTGVELQSALKLMNREFPIIFMSGNADKENINEAWRGGATDFLLKPFSPNQLSNSLSKLFAELIRSKELFVPEAKDDALIDIPIRQREAQVLLLLGKGHQQSEVADLLGITLRTVKMHRASLKHKLNLNTLIELTRYCDAHSFSIERIANPK